MLRCPPSRISLTPADLNGLDERLAARQSARLARQKASNVKLTHGPQRLTSSSFVSAEHNAGRKRARSSVSEATFHDDDNSYAQVVAPLELDNHTTSPLIEASSPSHLADSWKEADSADDPVRSLENVTQRQSPRRAMEQQRSTARHSPGTRHLQLCPANTSQAQPPGSLDGILERSFEYSSFDQTPRLPPIRQSRQVLGDIRAEIYPQAEGDRPVVEPPSNQRLLSSARARRWRVRSQDFQVRSFPEAIHSGDSHNHAYQRSLPRWRRNRAVHPVPEVVVYDEDSNTAQQPMLDPAAPAFVPRTRFGSVTRSFLDSGVTPFSSHYWGSLDSTRSQSNLRIRSTSEQNIDVQNPRPYRDSRFTESLGVRRFLNPNHDPYMEQQRSITGFNQGAGTTVQAAWDLDRYPVWRTSPGTDDQRGSDSLLAPNPGADADTARSRYTPSPRVHALPGQGHRQSHFRIYSTFANDVGDDSSFHPRTRSASPAVSTISHSTPNLLSMPRSASRIDSRDKPSSLSQSQSRPPSQSRFSRMVSGASGISSDDVPRRSSRQNLDAAEEFIRRRNSPLDELTERFSRMRSVGHSWGRPSGAKSRPSLLNGDPFGQGSYADTAARQITTAMTPNQPSIPAHVPFEEDQQEEELTDADPVALSLALPPSSPLPSGAQIVPSSPPLHESFSTSPRRPLAQLSPSKTPDLSTSPIARKPLPRTATTPRVNVYDDSQPPETQPQTPADLGRSRRARAESVNQIQQTPVTISRAMIDAPPDESISHASRHTYPSATAFLATTESMVLPPVTSRSTVAASSSRALSRDQTQTRARAQAQSGSEQIENDVERQLTSMEEDRRTWLSRHGTGTLDVTPPKEGRFERFLS